MFPSLQLSSVSSPYFSLWLFLTPRERKKQIEKTDTGDPLPPTYHGSRTFIFVSRRRDDHRRNPPSDSVAALPPRVTGRTFFFLLLPRSLPPDRTLSPHRQGENFFMQNWTWEKMPSYGSWRGIFWDIGKNWTCPVEYLF